MRNIGKNIKELRMEQKLTQEEFAEKLYVTRQTVSNYETGKTMPDLDMLMKIAAALDVDVNRLLLGPEPNPAPKIRLGASFWVSSALLLALIIASLVLHPLGEYYRSHYFLSGLSMFVKLGLDPILCIVAGWWLLNSLHQLLHLQPLCVPWKRTAKRITLWVLAAFAVFLAPYIVFFLAGTVQHLTCGYSNMGFPFIPVYIPIANALMDATLRFPAFYTLFGIALWLFGFAEKEKAAAPNPAD